MFRALSTLSVLALLVSQAPAAAQGVNPAASSKATEVPDDPGISPEAIDMLADAVIAKLKAKPEILLDIILSYEEKNRTGRAMIRPEDPVSGAADGIGDVTVVEFFDPSCIPCRTAGAVLEAAAVADPKLRIVHKDYPTTPEGIGLSVDALGGKSYSEARKAILAGRAPAPSDAAGRTKALEILARNRESAKRAQVEVLPTLFVVGPTKVERIEGPVTAAALATRISALRALRK
jgi:protein-disulfide isomerase